MIFQSAASQPTNKSRALCSGAIQAAFRMTFQRRTPAATGASAASPVSSKDDGPGTDDAPVSPEEVRVIGVPDPILPFHQSAGDFPFTPGVFGIPRCSFPMIGFERRAGDGRRGERR